MEKDVGRLKNINSANFPIIRIACQVDMQLGQWSEKVDMLVIPVDDYKLILGMKFFDQFCALILPHENAMVVLDPKCQCLVLSSFLMRMWGSL